MTYLQHSCNYQPLIFIVIYDFLTDFNQINKSVDQEQVSK
jgi:hypothetical protein